MILSDLGVTREFSLGIFRFISVISLIRFHLYGKGSLSTVNHAPSSQCSQISRSACERRYGLSNYLWSPLRIATLYVHSVWQRWNVHQPRPGTLRADATARNFWTFCGCSDRSNRHGINRVPLTEDVPLSRSVHWGGELAQSNLGSTHNPYQL